MATQPQKLSINLLPQKGLESTTSGRVLLWILSSFRIIVIVTEMIVMLAFLSRFWLDAKNTDLNEEISQKQAVLVASTDFEKEFKYTQKKLKILSGLTASNLSLSDALKTITSYLPLDVYLTAISYNSQNINLTGFSPNEKSIQQIIVNLESLEEFDKVTLSSIETGTVDSYLLEFRITILTKFEQKTNETT